MKRRDVLTFLGSGVAAAAQTADPAAQSCAVPGLPASYAAVQAVCPGDLDAYFSDERLRAIVDVSKPLPKAKYEVVAYNYPCWHPCPWMEARFGQGWTQFQALRDSKPLYPGHLYPKYPLWGEYNEADPIWAEREIDTAVNFGIDVWMHCWYWQEGVQRCHLQLQDGFLKAPNRNKLKFAVMWANHDYWNAWPAPTRGGKAAIISRQCHTEEDTLRVMDYCIEHYFRQPNYWRLGGGPVFGIYSIDQLLRDIPAPRLRVLFDRMREKVAKAGLGDLHLQASQFSPNDAAHLNEFGIQSATRYHTFHTALGKVPLGGRLPYGEAAVQTVSYWRQLREKSPVPFFPDCPAGWDDSPRRGTNSKMVTQRSPDQFERLMIAAKYFLAESSANVPKIVFLSSWNEWTEDHVILPDTVYGYSYLEAVRRTFRG
ncbi:MAG: glycoside hydrolase family 99-like domain-containing protein [Bryobacteraceae bacterium]